MRSRTIFAALFVSVMLIGLYPTEANAIRIINSAMNEESISFLNLLARIGKTYDCYFTVESAWADGEPMNVMDSRLITSPQDTKGLQATLDNLKVAMPNVIFTIDQTNDRIVHVIDARLLKQEGYGLTQVLKSVDFSGSLNDLLNFIGKQGIPIGPVGLVDLREASVQDHRTTVHVKGNNLQVRDLLSNHIPLEGRGRIIWIARTKLEKGEITRVQFRMKELP